jgi:hypothetical protein
MGADLTNLQATLRSEQTLVTMVADPRRRWGYDPIDGFAWA